MIALAILTMGILALLGAVSTTLRASNSGMRLAEATEIATNQLEIAVTRPSAELHPREASKGPFHWSLQYAPKPQGLVMASVLIEWTEHGEPRSYRVSQLFRPT